MFRQSISSKIILSIALVAIIVVSGFAYNNIVLKNEKMLDDFIIDSYQFNEIIIQQLKYTMLNYVNKENFQNNIEDCIKDEEDIKIRVINRSGIIFFSSNKIEIGKSIDSCYIPEKISLKKATEIPNHQIFKSNGHKILAITTAIPNEKNCCKCHPKEQDIIGMLELNRDLTELDRKKFDQTKGIILLAFLRIFILFFLIMIIIRQLVLKPINELVVMTRKASEGNYNYSLPVYTNDEFGFLKNEFNNMMRVIEINNKKLKEKNNDLEKMIDKLQEAQEKLIRAEKLAALGQIAGSICHEINNPLGAISNAVYFLKMTLSDATEKTIEYLDIINSEVLKGNKIVSDLRDFSKTELIIQKEKIEISSFILELLKRNPPPEKINVITRLKSNLPYVLIDEFQIEQVLRNLLHNAYQAMSVGGELQVIALEDNGQVAISIKDTGCGISQENLKKIFEPLFTTKARGLGLGLSICENLIKINGGTITVESLEGSGSTFTITLPINEGCQ